MAFVGAWARIDLTRAAAVARDLAGFPGVETFDLEVPGKLGLLIEADDLESAHHMLTVNLTGCEGVLGIWPVYVHDEEADDPARQAKQAVSGAVEQD